VDSIGEHDFFFVHMTQHILIGDLAPLCFVAGLTGPILRPVLKYRTVERLRILTHPFVALPVWAVNLYVWHLPVLYEAALHHSGVHALEHLLFFTCGALMWSPVIETLPAPRWFGTGAKLGYIAVVRVVEAVLGNVFIWTSHAIYPFYVHAPIWGINAVHDQNYAGVIMMLEGSFVTFGAIVWLFLKLASEGELRQQLIEQGADPAVVSRAIRYGRGRELQLQLELERSGGDARGPGNS
jgi:cytochrome c oxidase assembly factor CtaG